MVGNCQHLGNKVGASIINDVMATMTLGHLDLGITAHRTDHHGTQGPRPLTKHFAHAASGGVHQQRLPWLDLMQTMKQIFGSEPPDQTPTRQSRLITITLAARTGASSKACVAKSSATAGAASPRSCSPWATG